MLGDVASDSILPLTSTMPMIRQPNTAWLEKLARVESVDPGEAQIFAVAAETGLTVISGDKRALCALKGISDFVEALRGKIVTLEAILIALCDRCGLDEVRRRVQTAIHCDKMVRVCFSPGNTDTLMALNSYYRSTITELDPLVLWNPRSGGSA